MCKTLEKELCYLKELKRNLDQELSIPFEGKLYGRKSHNSYQYYVDGKYLPKNNIVQAINLAQYEYNKKVNHQIESIIKVIESFSKTYLNNPLDNIYYNMPPSKQALITPVQKTIKQMLEEFDTEEFEPGQFDKEANELYTIKNERVRSKSEVLIANALYHHGIHYKYEKPLLLNVGDHKKLFRPDFTIMVERTGEIKYLEHLGMLDNSDYFANNLDKLGIYERNGLLIGRDIILLHEVSYSQLSTRTIDNYINEFLI